MRSRRASLASVSGRCGLPLGEPPGLAPGGTSRARPWGNLAGSPLGEPPGLAPGGTSRFPQTPSTGPLRGRGSAWSWGNLPVPPDPFHWSASQTDATRLPRPAREKAEEREHEDDDENDPEDAHAIPCLPFCSFVDLLALIPQWINDKTPRAEAGTGRQLPRSLRRCPGSASRRPRPLPRRPES